MRRLVLALALAALPRAHAQVTADIYDLGAAPAVRSDVHVFAFRDDIFRFDDLGRSRDYDRAPDRWGMRGGYQPIRGPLAGPPVYGPEVFAPSQAVRIRVVMEIEDPKNPADPPAFLRLLFPGTGGEPFEVRARRRRPASAPVQGRSGSDETETQAGYFGAAGDTLVNGRMYRVPGPYRSETDRRVIWSPMYEATVDLEDVYQRTSRSVAESFAVLGGPDPLGAELQGVLTRADRPGVPGREDAESRLLSWVKRDSEHGAVKHRRGHKTASVIPFVVARPDGTPMVGGPGASDEDLRQARLVVRHVPDWLFVGCGASNPLAPKDFVGSSLQGAVEVLMLGPCALVDDAKEDFPTSDGPNHFYLQRPDGYWWWRVSEATVVGFRRPPDPEAAAATIRAFVDAAGAVQAPEPPPPGKDWQHPDHLPDWQTYSRALAAAWIQAGDRSGAAVAAIDVEGDLHTADGLTPRAEWEPQGTGFVGLEVYESIVWDEATSEAEEIDPRVVPMAERQQSALRARIPEIQEVRAELIETFRSRPPETLDLLFDQPAYQKLSSRMRVRERDRLRETQAAFTETREEQFEVALRLAFSEYILRMEREVYRDFGRIDTEHSRMSPVETAIYLTTHNSSAIGYQFPEDGDTFEAATERAYATLSPPYEAGSRSYLGPLAERTDDRAIRARVEIQRGILRAYLKGRYQSQGTEGLGKFLGLGDRGQLVAYLGSPGNQHLLGTVAQQDPELAKEVLAARRR